MTKHIAFTALVGAVAVTTAGPASAQDMRDVVTGIVGGIINEALIGQQTTPLGPLVPGNPGFPGNPGIQSNQGWPNQPTYPNYPNGPAYQAYPFGVPAPIPAPVPAPTYATPSVEPPPNPAAQAEPYTSSAQWLAIQQRLTALGHAPGPIDGIPGTRTRDAVERFQAASGETITGYLTADQRAALLAPGAAPVATDQPATPDKPTTAPNAGATSGTTPGTAPGNGDLAALVSAYISAEVGAAGLWRDPPDTRIDYVELNGTAPSEAIVMLEGPAWCGAAGCSVAILDLSAGEAREIGQFTAQSVDVMGDVMGDVAGNMSGGADSTWQDLMVNGETRATMRDGIYTTVGGTASSPPAEATPPTTK